MIKKVTVLICVFLVMPLLAMAQDVVVTRNFTGGWDQTDHESQGISLQVIDQDSGEKVAVAYWFTYGDDDKSAWFLGIGPVIGNRIEMTLYEASGVGFLEDNNSEDDPVVAVGTMEMEFSGCDDGVVTFATDLVGVGSGTFPISRLTDLFNTDCSGGVSDDTPSDVSASEQRISLVAAREGGLASGHADFEERADRTSFSVEVEDMVDGSYRIVVGGVDRGELVVNMGIGETEFRSPVEAGKVLLTFDPRGELVEIHDAEGAVLTSGEVVPDPGDGDGDPVDFGMVEIDVDLTNTGVYPLASGDARLRPESDRTDFKVEIEDVPVGSYTLRIADQVVGTIIVVMLEDGSVEGELEFRNPVEPGKILLDFDPRGQQIDVLEGSTVILETLFPSG
jgi:hypothetical protein